MGMSARPVGVFHRHLLQLVLFLVRVGASLSHQYYGPRGADIVTSSLWSPLARLASDYRQLPGRSKESHTEVRLYPVPGQIRYRRSATGAILYRLSDETLAQVTTCEESVRGDLSTVREVVLFESVQGMQLAPCVEAIKDLLQQKKQLSAHIIPIECSNIDLVICQVNTSPLARTLHALHRLPLPLIKCPSGLKNKVADVQKARLYHDTQQSVRKPSKRQDILSYLHLILLAPDNSERSSPPPMMSSPMSVERNVQLASKPLDLAPGSLSDVPSRVGLNHGDLDGRKGVGILPALDDDDDDDDAKSTAHGDGLEALPRPQSDKRTKGPETSSLPLTLEDFNGLRPHRSATSDTHEPSNSLPPRPTSLSFRSGADGLEDGNVIYSAAASRQFQVGECVMVKHRKCNTEQVGPFVVVAYDRALNSYHLMIPGNETEYVFEDRRLKSCSKHETRILELYHKSHIKLLKVGDLVNIVNSKSSGKVPSEAVETPDGNPYIVTGLGETGQYLLMSRTTGKRVRLSRQYLELIGTATELEAEVPLVSIGSKRKLIASDSKKETKLQRWT